MPEQVNVLEVLVMRLEYLELRGLILTVME